MKNYFTLLALLFAAFTSSFAQKQTNHWYFGNNAGLDFSTGTAVAADNGALSTTEGCSAISTPAGQLLFYTDGITVYDNQHSIMPNGTGLDGNVSSTQSALIVPQPSSNLYYIFTCDADGGPLGFRYSIVDMTLNSGHGDVTTKNVPLITSSDEKVSAVMAADGVSYWVMAHEWGSNAFYAYNLSATGLNTTPVISNTGTVHNTTAIQNAYGQMKFSPDASKLACGVYLQGITELFDFNDTTAVVSNPRTITNGDRNYGVEFSQDNSRLYITRYNFTYDLYYIDQFDLSSGDSLTIVSSQVTLASANAYRALQLALDGKIYVAEAFNSYLGVINFPDSLGLASNFDDFGINVDDQFLGHVSALGLPGFVQSWLKLQPPVAAFISGDTTVCSNSCIDFKSLSTGASSWQWFFQGGTPSTSSDENPHICYINAGTYDVKLVVTNSAGSDSITATGLMKIIAAPPTPIITPDGNILYCSTDPSYTAYQWYLDSVIIPNATDTFYVASQSGNYNVSVSNENGCSVSVGINIILGINQATPETFSIYPNPVSNQLMVYGLKPMPVNARFEIYDLLGKRVGNPVIVNSGKQWTIDVSKLPRGVYFLRFETGKESVLRKFVKQ